LRFLLSSSQQLSPLPPVLSCAPAVFAKAKAGKSVTKISEFSSQIPSHFSRYFYFKNIPE
ncbi:MAG: hypothetical protein LUC35_08740, partial [Clostridiales bacterium]|nr:hypothetical protein [Clostridiales bacterium]